MDNMENEMDNTDINIRQFSCNEFSEHCYLVWDADGNAVLVDPGFKGSEELDELYGFIGRQGLKPAAILLTHAHFDHIYGVKECVDKYGATIYMHPDDSVVKEHAAQMARTCFMPAPDTSWTTTGIKDGEILTFGRLEFKVIETPGHSPGSVSYFAEKDRLLFSGDCLFAGSIGRTDLEWGDYDKEIVSIMDKIMGLDGDVKVYPGHGGSTTIADERTGNPFLQPFNWKDPETGYVDGIEFR